MTEFLEKLYLVVSIVVGLITIITGIFGSKREYTKRKKDPDQFHKPYLIIFIFVGFIGILLILSSFFIFPYLKAARESKLQNEIRYSLIRVRDEFENYVLTDFTKILNDTNGIMLEDTNRVINAAEKLYRKITTFHDSKLDIGLAIFKYDYLCYTSVIIAALEKNSKREIDWANKAIEASQMAFTLADSVKTKSKKTYDDFMVELIKWFEEDDVENRLNYLWAWALAIKLINRDPFTTPKEIEDKINEISIGVYLDRYPLTSNYHFQKVKGQFNEEFRKDYYRE